MKNGELMKITILNGNPDGNFSAFDAYLDNFSQE